jgi:hypothetical protein
MRRLSTITTALAVVALTGCANNSGAYMTLTSAHAPVIAILQDDLFTGEAIGYMDRTGTIDIKSALNPELRCVGRFRYTGSKNGIATVQCNDGNEAELSFNGLSMLSGYGYGKSTRGPASFTFGLTPDEASTYLKLPANKKLVTKDKRVEMIDI